MRRNPVISYFTHYRGERNGAIVVVIITIVVIVTLQVVPWHKFRGERKIDQVHFLLAPASGDIKMPENLFSFDPNTLSDSGYLELGFTERQIATLRNYQKAGGEFRIKKDFAKLYFVDSVRYHMLEAYIDLPESRKRKERRVRAERPPRKSKERVAPTLFGFDPNTLSDSGYAALGFSRGQISTLRKYQQGGGSFGVKEDFANLYFVDEERFEELYDFIELPTKSEREMEWRESLQTDINSATPSDLRRIPGIGAYYANEIVALRTSLGGFYALHQLEAIYNMTPGRIDTLSEFLQVHPGSLSKFSLRTATAQELAEHPYMDLKTASELVRWRETAIDISPESLEESGLLNDELYRKFAPYLDYR